MKIIRQSREFNKVELYMMTQSSLPITFNEIPDHLSFPVDGYLLYEDLKEREGTVELLAFLSHDESDNSPKVYTTQSATCKDSFFKIVEMIGDSGYNLIKLSGVSKGGRDYVNCDLDFAKFYGVKTKQEPVVEPVSDLPDQVVE